MHAKAKQAEEWDGRSHDTESPTMQNSCVCTTGTSCFPVGGGAGHQHFQDPHGDHNRVCLCVWGGGGCASGADVSYGTLGESGGVGDMNIRAAPSDGKIAMGP